jgi:hypothetical protein
VCLCIIQQQQDKTMENQGRRQQKTKKNTISKKSQKLLDKFNLLRVCTWLNLSTMEKNKEYSITNIKRQTTQYGERLVVELDGVCKLSLPERYNTITENQLKEIRKNKYNLLNRGSQGRSYKLELTPKSNQSERQETTKKYIIPKYKQNILKKFNLLSSFTWLNLSTMEKNKEYSITKMKRETTKYGDRVMVELDGACRLFLPERFNTLTNTQLRDIGRKNKYNLLNRGNLSLSHELELSLKSNSEGTSTIEQEVVKQPASLQQESSSLNMNPGDMVLNILGNTYLKQQ